MKKLSIITTLLIGSLLLTGCSFHLNVNTNNNTPEENNTISNLTTDVARLMACNDKVGFYLNTDTFNASWDTEQEGWASFILNWHITREEDWNIAEDDVECVVDMVDWSVTVEFFNHMYNWELHDTVIDEETTVEEPTVSDVPVAKMRVLEWETTEETMERMEEACTNMWGEQVDGACTLEDGSIIYF